MYRYARTTGLSERQNSIAVSIADPLPLLGVTLKSIFDRSTSLAPICRCLIVGISLFFAAIQPVIGNEEFVVQHDSASKLSPTETAIAQPSMVGDSPLRPLTTTSSGSFSSILENRIRHMEGGEEPEFNFPDACSDPVQRWRDQFGLTGPADEFLFPWAVNLVFEDRWLLADQDANKALKNQLLRRTTIDIRDPDPDIANFPNGAYTLPKGRAYIETSPVGFYGPSRNGSQPPVYQSEFLLRYGLTDNLEFRLFSNGVVYQSAQGSQPAVVGFSPLAFDFKVNFWEENTRYHIPAMGVEMYIQTEFGSPAFNRGTQPSLNLLFDQSLPWEISFEYNFGITGVQNGAGEIAYQFSFQWSLQRQLVKDFDVFWHGFYNAAALPRLVQFQNQTSAGIPNVTATGFGAIWTLNNRFALFGSLNFGITPAAPEFFALSGFAIAL